MKTQHKDLIAAVMAILLSFPVKEYSGFLSGLMLGAAVILAVKAGLQSIKRKTV